MHLGIGEQGIVAECLGSTAGLGRGLGGLMLGALADDGPVVYLEHKLLADYWRDYLGAGGRSTVSYDVPAAGEIGPVPDVWEPIPLGSAVTRREGDDLTMVSVGVGVHRALEAAERLAAEHGAQAGVIDLRSVQPLDRQTVCEAVEKSRRMLVVDEDYRDFGLSGELAATLLEAGIQTDFSRLCVEGTIPFDPRRERLTLPNAERITEAAVNLLQAR